MISIVCYLWRGSRDFKPAYTGPLARMARRYLSAPHRFLCVTDLPAAEFPDEVEVLAMPAAARALLALRNPGGDKFPSSYPRLWSFSPEARALLGARILQIDVDCMIVAPIDQLLEQSHDFVGWRLPAPPGGPQRVAGGTWLHRTGTRERVWEEFTSNPQAAIDRAAAAGYRGSDQAWLSYCLAPSAHVWPEPSGIVCAQDYRRHNRPVRRAPHSRPYRLNVQRPPAQALPPGTAILHMNGKAKPWSVDDWITRKYWSPYT